MQRSTLVRVSGIALLFVSLVIGIRILVGSSSFQHMEVPEKDFHRFPGVSGPAKATVMPDHVPTTWRTYEQGSTSRLAILLTDPDSSWLGLAHGLKSIGVPFRITRDVHEA
ncbi:MAG: hypothetical protein DYH03_19720, partial [Nitrospira sp. NTP1]|nr:hypothetical protein [Nitrospira sp. NTP1]